MHHLNQIILKHHECIKCPLSAIRIINNQKVAFIHGMFNAIGLVIIPQPIYTNEETPSIYGPSAKELQIMKSIWAKVKLDPNLWAITTAIGCKGEITKENVDSCSERLSDIVWAISPKIIVTCGNKSAYAYTKKTPPKIFGPVNSSPNDKYKWIHTYDITDYLKVREEDPQMAIGIATQMMEHWQHAADYISSLVCT